MAIATISRRSSCSEAEEVAEAWLPQVGRVWRASSAPLSFSLGRASALHTTIRDVITAVHLLIYSDDPVATRSFLRDVLEWQFVEEEWAPGWLIFKSGPSELGVHPTNETYEGETYTHPRHHSISLMCDDLEATRTELERKGAEFTGPIEEQDFGLTLMLKIPGADDIMLYEPRHPQAYDL
jgi:predicted enzyme related to lactoylglutathione lyase